MPPTTAAPRELASSTTVRRCTLRPQVSAIRPSHRSLRAPPPMASTASMAWPSGSTSRRLTRIEPRLKATPSSTARARCARP